MKEGIRRMGQILAAVLLFPFRLLARFLGAMWRFVGRMGLALRRLIWLSFGRPAVWLGRAVWFFLEPAWHFTGRVGLAIRRLIDRLLWRPLLWVSTPLRWLYRKTLHPIVRFAWLSLKTFADWLIRQAVVGSLITIGGVFLTNLQGLGRAAILWRRRFKHQLISQLTMRWARLRAGISRSQPPDEAIYAPPVPRSAPPTPAVSRIATALAATGLILLVGVVTSQAREPQPPVTADDAAASAATVVVIFADDAADDQLSANQPAKSQPQPEPTVAAATPWPTPDPLTSGGSLAFSQRRNGNSDLYLLPLNQKTPIRLTSHPADDIDPAWSPDGRRLAFASNREGNWDIYILEIASGQISRVTTDPGFDGGPSWSPDGQWLVFESYRSANLDLYITRADGSGPAIRLTEHPAPDYSPVWAPSGRQIAFTSWRSGNMDIYIMSLDAASDERALNVTASPDRYEDHAVFDAQGTALAYHDQSGGFELVYEIRLEDYRPAGLSRSVGQGRHPSWSPDGQSLVYIHDDGRQNHVIASSISAWTVAPQAFTSEDYLDHLAWSAVSLTEELITPAAEVNGLSEDRPLYIEQVQPPAGEDQPPYLLWEVDVDAPSPYLSDRVDQSFAALRERVIEEAGWDFLGQVDNMYATISAKPLPGQVSRSWDKAGRAFDFYYRYPLADDPQVEIVREDQGFQTMWRVYLKAAQQDGSQGQPLRKLPWDFRARYGFDPLYYDQGGKWKDYIPAGYYVDFTDLAADYGWYPVAAAENWRTLFQGIRYWRFENHQGLTWEQAMLEIYSADELLEAFRDP
jgi:TolB protein